MGSKYNANIFQGYLGDWIEWIEGECDSDGERNTAENYIGRVLKPGEL